ncbi:MAG: DNA-3-methyladenine glycosylase I [Gammaproteobacteria bacterium]|nr:DNA-3-methyladenine glycosylase I [Gammaproteobacteria bacterium]
MRQTRRCAWVKDDALEVAYHDKEWGVPTRDQRKLFEFLILEGAQAGLSWSTVLAKREGYRAAFAQFDAQTVAGYDDRQLKRLLDDPRIVRNRLKIASAVNNARRFLEVTSEFGAFADYLWGFTDNRAIHTGWADGADIPATTKLSEALSRDLKRRGFTFVGSTICYAYMQAVGLVNDHTRDCFRYAQIKRIKLG